MLFNSLEFVIFIIIVFFLYWFVFNKNLRIQNFFIILVSYIFYGWWDWRFLSLIIISSFIDYFVGILLSKEEKIGFRRLYLILSLCTNLGLLGFFKYYNFFVDSFIAAFARININLNIHSLNIILPVGISFYTFQTMSYSIDVYKKNMPPTKNIIDFFAFVCFFPQLVAGPIERAHNLLPQFYKKRVFDYEKGIDGIKQILWGLFKKVVIADNCAKVVNLVFGNFNNYSGSTLVLATIFFAFQIYGDFSGYSDIAIGLAKLFGFNLMTNFKTPYFSKSIPEFWQRWHISLSTWFRDYVYLPLGGSKVGKIKHILNTFIVFTVSGFWHGANWTFIFWGFLNSIYYLPKIIFKRYILSINKTKLTEPKIVNKNSIIFHIKEFSKILFTFGLVCFAWIFFRSESLTFAFLYIRKIFSASLFENPAYKKMLAVILFFVLIEWFKKDEEYPLKNISKYKFINGLAYLSIMLLIVLYSPQEKLNFIYFQF